MEKICHNSSEMYLNPRTKIHRNTYFRVPHQQLPITAGEIRQQFKQFAREMDGRSADACLDFFYKKDKESGIYEFVDADAEEEVAEIMGVKVIEFCEEEEVDSDGELIRSNGMNEGDIARHRENIAMIRTGLKKIGAISDSDSFSSDDSSDSSSDDSSDSDSSA
jgi:hypothetical protein